MYLHTQHQSHSIHQKMTLSPLHVLACVKSFAPFDPPFSVVLTLWLSITDPEGSGLRPALMRTSLRKMSFSLSNKPLSLHLMKYQYTLLQGGRSEGIILHAMPPLKTYSMPLTISRRGYLGGLPVEARGGSNGSNLAHCLSVRSVGYRFASLILLLYYISPVFRHPLRMTTCSWRSISGSAPYVGFGALVPLFHALFCSATSSSPSPEP
jgi:hypothetical protein